MEDLQKQSSKDSQLIWKWDVPAGLFIVECAWMSLCKYEYSVSEDPYKCMYNLQQFQALSL